MAKCGFDFYDYDLKPAIGRDNKSSLLEMTLKQAEPTGPLRVGVYVFSHTLSSLFPFETFSSIQVSHFGRSSTDSLFKRYIEKKTPIEIKFSTLVLTSCKGIQKRKKRRVSTWNWLFKDTYHHVQYQPRCSFDKSRWNFVWQKLFTTGYRLLIEKSCLFTN